MHLRVRLDDPGELGFPVAVAHHPVDIGFFCGPVCQRVAFDVVKFTWEVEPVLLVLPVEGF